MDAVDLCRELSYSPPSTTVKIRGVIPPLHHTLARFVQGKLQLKVLGPCSRVHLENIRVLEVAQGVKKFYEI